MCVHGVFFFPPKMNQNTPNAIIPKKIIGSPDEATDAAPIKINVKITTPNIPRHPIGSFLFSLIPLILFSYFSYLDLEFNLSNITYCLLISLISQLGDLFVSYLKRKSKIKDTGKILPGHGGILDRVDGIIFAVPFSYFLLKII